MLMTSLMIFLHLIPTMICLTIFLTTIFLMILPLLPANAVMMLLTVWLGWKLKSNGAAAQRKSGNALPARQR
jgi:hypothetical protein